MPVSPATGFPDYERLSLQASKQIAVLSGEWGVTNETGWLDTTGFGYLDISWNTLGDTALGLVTLIWATDPNGSNQIFNNQFMPVASSTGCLQYPVLSRWVQVQAGIESGPNTDSYTIQIFGANAYAPRLIPDFGAGPLCVIKQAISASSSVQATFLTTYHGPATFSVHDPANSKWRANIEWWNYLFAEWDVLIGMWGAQQGQSGVVAVTLPPLMCRINLFNLDTVVNTIYATVTA